MWLSSVAHELKVKTLPHTYSLLRISKDIPSLYFIWKDWPYKPRLEGQPMISVNASKWDEWLIGNKKIADWYDIVWGAKIM